MPQIRYFHRGRYFRPSKPFHFLPPLKLTTGATPHHKTADSQTRKKTTSTRRHCREGKHSRYRKMVLTLTSYLTLGNVADMKFLCRDHVRPPQVVDEVTSAKHLFALLENQRLLAENSLYFLQTLLYYIARPDLYQIVLDFRADRQEDYVDRGVCVADRYQVNQEDDVQRLQLANELLRFRKDLKPRRRLNQVDVNQMRRKLEALSIKMQDNLSSIQPRPNVPSRALDDSSSSGDDGAPSLDAKPHTRADAGVLDLVPEREESDRDPPHAAQNGSTSADDHDNRATSAGKSKEESVVRTSSPDSKEGEDAASDTEACPLTDGGYTTDDEVDNSDEAFGYETPCPPPRQNALIGINGVKVYDVVGSHRHPVKPSGVEADRSPATSTQTNHVTTKINRLRRLSKEQRTGNTTSFQTKKKKKKTKRISSKSNDDRAVTDSESANGKDDIKLPDIYDKYARQTAVQFNS